MQLHRLRLVAFTPSTRRHRGAYSILNSIQRLPRVPMVCSLVTVLLFCLLSARSVNAAADSYQSRKVSVSEVSFDSAVDDIQWAGTDHSTVIALTNGGHLFTSHDSGKTWNEITGVFSQEKDSKLSVNNILVNTVDRNVVLVAGSRHVHYISEDAARTFRRIELDAPIHNWIFHPKSPRKALLSTWTEACTRPGGRAGKEDDCNHVLYVTSDLGKSFKIVSTYVVQYNWGDTKRGQENRIFFSHHRARQGSQSRAAGWTKAIDLSYADLKRDGVGSTNLLVHHGNKFLISGGYIFVARVESEELQTVTLLVSSDGGDTFEAAKLPAVLHQKSFTILDASENSVMIHVNHGNGMHEDTGNVYISDQQGLRYSLSLPNNVRTPSGDAEFDKVASLEGVYLANFKDQNYLTPTHHEHHKAPSNKKREGDRDDDDWSDESFEDDLLEEEEEQDEESALGSALDLRHRSKAGKIEEPVRTVVSFDKGGVWSYLKPPRVDSRGNPIECANPQRCWLHLHGVSNFHQFAPFYSIENAVGIIMGTGNVGSQLRYEESEINTFLSRDGGVTWIEAHKGAFIYEFGDHGGLLVMADDTRKTNQVVFSWNEGQSWYDFELGVEGVEVDNIVIEPNSSSLEFLLYGTRGDSGVLFHLDFAALQQPPCKGVWAADSVSSDYETWIPTDGRNTGQCLLGRQQVFTRRKQTSECFNGKAFDRPVTKNNCACTEADYECEFGFTRHIDSMTCHPDMESPDIFVPFCRTGKYYVTHAYRKVPGDTCEGGWVPTQVRVPCPAHSPFSKGAKTVLWSLLFVGIFVALITWISKNPDLNSKLFNSGFDSFRNVRYSMVGGHTASEPKAGTFSGRSAQTFHFQGVSDGDDDEMEDFVGEDGRGGNISSGRKAVEEGSEMGATSGARERRGAGASSKGRQLREDRYEPELGFIESAKDEQESAPALMNYNYGDSHALSSSSDDGEIL